MYVEAIFFHFEDTLLIIQDIEIKRLIRVCLWQN